MDEQRPSLIYIRAQDKSKRAIQKELPILEDGQKYIIGNSQSNQNSIVLPFGITLSRDHFELDYSLLLIPQSISQFSTEYNQVLRSFNIEQGIIDIIGQFTINNNQKLQIKDISGRKGYPSLINITKQCENQVLIKESIYIIGQKSQLKVQQNNQLFGDFLESSELFDITQKTIVLGLCQGLDKLFKDSFQGMITKNDFYKTLKSKELEQEFQEFYSKGCLYIKVTDDMKDQRYLLVENSFTIGRSEQSDIRLKCNLVSKNHGMILYINEEKKWIIIDGYLNDQSWQGSSNGTWLQMTPLQNYYLDKEQLIKVLEVEINIGWI